MLSLILPIAGFLLFLAVHEAAHAWAGDRLGDPTARLAGRISLNPLVHLDPIGTLLPLFLILTGSPLVIGWGKPVPFDPYNLRNPRRDSALIAFAGPAANLIMAVTIAILLRLAYLFVDPRILGQVVATAVLFIVINVSWAVFNLLPIHPLDGGKVLIGLLPEKLAQEWDETLHCYGLIVLILVIFPIFGRSIAEIIISPITKVIIDLLLYSLPS